MQTKAIHEGTVSFEGATGINRNALNRACDIASKNADKRFYQSMRNPLTAASYGVRPWPEKLTAETVASWIMANVTYSCPRDAHHILRALQLENNA